MRAETETAALDPFRTGKAYSVQQAARLAGTTTATVRRWLAGYDVPGHRMAPVFGGLHLPPAEAPRFVSFLQLVEIVVVARFRQGKQGQGRVTLERLRRAHAYARQVFGLAYPFASLKLQAEGGHVLHSFDEQEPGQGALALDLGGQWTLPGLVRNELTHLEYATDSLATRWFPGGRDVPVVIDPHLAAGRLSVVGSGVTVDTIRKRFGAGQSMAFIAEDFHLELTVVEKVLQYATAVA